ncbi:MAG: DUF3857 domain-containing protein, partial [Victivallales bacterium]|nr:DUF3857 domain-containing protein [Victivallales bacterium]
MNPDPPAPLIALPEAVTTAKRVTREQYPDADIVLIRNVQKVKYQADGTADELDEFYYKILTEKGKRQVEVFREFFMKAYTRVHIWAIEIIKPDGKTVKIDIARNAKETIYSGQMGANIYDPNLKLLNVTIPGLEIGDIIRYFVQRTTFMPRMKGIWTNLFVIQSTTPAIYYEVEIDGPAAKPLKKILIKNDIKDSSCFSRKQLGDRIIYTWTFSNVPQLFPEPQMPPLYLYAQRLLVSTAASWEEISKWYDQLCAAHLEKTSPEMKAEVAKLLKGLKTEGEKIEAIFRFVSTQVRYLGLTLETTAPGYEPHDIDITFKNRYGVCRDKAALLAGMLRLAGIKSYPVLIASDKKDQEVPNNFFGHAITSAITSEGKTILMDSTNESTREIFPAYLSNKSYLPAMPEGSDLLTSPVIPVENNLVQVETAGSFSEGGCLHAHTVLKFDGINDTIYRGAFSRWKTEEIKQFFARRLKAMLPGLELENFKITPENLRDFQTPLQVEFTFSTGSLLTGNPNAMLLQIPQPGTAFGVVNSLLRSGLGLKKREYPLKLFSTCGSVENFQYKIPPELKIIKVPEFPQIDWDKMLWKRSLKFADGQLSGSTEYLLKAVEFLPPEYLRLKDDVKNIQFQDRKMLILEKDCAQGKDLAKLFPTATAVMLSRKSLIDINDQESFTVTSAYKKRIMNYAGVKSNSEIKIHYNPVWQEVRVNSVKITAPDGKVFQLDKSESNIMDQGWNGSAPRYPGGKILVVSLPGIQAGSLVEYELVSKNRKQPFVSTTALFREDCPLLEEEVSLRYPEKLAVKLAAAAVSGEPDTAKNGKIIKTWKCSNIDAIPPEINTPPSWLFVPRLEISTGNWKDYSAALKKQLETAAANQPESEKLALELSKDKKPEAAMRTIRNYVARKIRVAGPALNALPFSCISSADKTLTDAYGNSGDRAVLLYAMLKKAGFKPEFIAVANVPAVSEALAELKNCPANKFAGILVKLEHGGKAYYFNDTSQYAQPGSCRSEGKVILKLNTAELEFLEISGDLGDLVRQEYSLKLLDDGSVLVSSTGFYYGSRFEDENRFFAEITPEKRKRHFQRVVSDIAQSAEPITKFTSDFSTYPGKVHFAVKIPDYVVRDGKYQYFKLPGNELRNLISTGTGKRENPYFQNRDFNKQIKYSVSLPENIGKIALKPENLSLNYPGNGGKITVAGAVSPEILEINYGIRLRPCIVPADEYPLVVNIQ